MSTLVWLNRISSLPAGIEPQLRHPGGGVRAVPGDVRHGLDRAVPREPFLASHSSRPQPLRVGSVPLRARLQARTEGRMSAWQHGRI
jgi:hypothetical protein